MHKIEKGESFFCSWSGGKDSYLALYRAIKSGGVPKYLFTMLHEDGTRTRSHSIPMDVLRAQANCLNIPLVTDSATWGGYEEVFINVLHKFREEGISAGVFGDIDLQQHLEWEERVCGTADIKACLPLWKNSRLDIINELLQLGCQAMIVTINTKMMDVKYLGREITAELVEQLKLDGIDPCGENGEFHTIVYNGPFFSTPFKFVTGKPITHSEHYISITLAL